MQEGFDVAVRSHRSPLPDSDLVQRRLRVQPIALVAAPAYLATRGTPNHPEDLTDHDGVLASEIANTCRLHSDDGEEIAVTPRFDAALSRDLILVDGVAPGA